jgi:hypothetical protein
MSCCGSKREALKQSLSSAINEQASKETLPAWNDVLFEYTGIYPASYKGSVTGKRYHFTTAGEQQLIDYRDVSGMRAETFLKKVTVKNNR